MGRGDGTPQKEPDMKRTVKKIVKFQPPCTMELAAMLDCMKRHPGVEGDTACAGPRNALAICARTSKPSNVSNAKRQIINGLRGLTKAWRRSGF
mmetsp:Transcript_22645/g.62530  ORF Transcript_22645/g.62530 Transcript_22645/m.62530 type:complete len:94 (+) Transcript_22645:111-392(+)